MRNRRPSWPHITIRATWGFRPVTSRRPRSRKQHYRGANDTGSHVTEEDQETDQGLRIILDASTRRLQAHKIYLRAAAAMRWVQLRTQLLRGEKPSSRHVNGLRAIDQRLRQVCFNSLVSSRWHGRWRSLLAPPGSDTHVQHFPCHAMWLTGTR